MKPAFAADADLFQRRLETVDLLAEITNVSIE